MNNAISKIKGYYDNIKSAFMEDQEKQLTNTEDQPAEQPEAAAANQTYKPGAFQVFAAIFNGLGVGLLLGFLLGLAVSPVVSGVIATISSLLAVLLGLNERFLGPAKSIRIGSFGLFAVVGILAGMYIRANNPLSPSLQDLKKEYTDLGYTQDEALDFITYLEFELKPEEWEGRISDSATAPKRRANQLYSANVPLDRCRYIESADETMAYPDILNSFTRAGGIWEEFTTAFNPDTPDDVKTGALLAMRDSFCGYGDTGVKSVSGCDGLANVSSIESLEEIKQKLINSGETWGKIISNLEERVDKEYQREILISFTNILCHE